MKSINGLSRRQFINSAAAGLSYLFIPGVGRVKADPNQFAGLDDFTGRLCYNENPLGPSPDAIIAMQDASSMAHRYPDWFSSNLENQIAAHHGLQQNNICVGAGATEIIRLIADAFLNPGDELITATPTYTQMANEAISNGATVVYVPVNANYVIDLQAISQAISPSTKMISLVNPNNPLATFINKTNMDTFLNSLLGGIIVVVDEAYFHYVQSSDYESCISYITAGLPVIVIRTLSKAYGLAGARIGYAVASSGYISQIVSSQLFGTVSNISQAAASAALADTTHITNTVILNNGAKNYLTINLTNLNLNYIPSETNFIMFDIGIPATTVASRLVSAGYQVRTGWSMPQHIRVSTGLLTEMEGFINALTTILGGSGTNNIDTPKNFKLSSVYPNPFNSSCNIKISTVTNEKVYLIIYDTLGRKIRTLLNHNLTPGTHTIPWDGKDIFGNVVASGVYIFSLVQGEFESNYRATMIK
jgi:histidinol-phosphate aminotransferase